MKLFSKVLPFPILRDSHLFWEKRCWEVTDSSLSTHMPKVRTATVLWSITGFPLIRVQKSLIISHKRADFFFTLSEEKGPIEETGDIVASNEFTKANALIDFFLGFNQVQGTLRKKLETVRG